MVFSLRGPKTKNSRFETRKHPDNKALIYQEIPREGPLHKMEHTAAAGLDASHHKNEKAELPCKMEARLSYSLGRQLQVIAVHFGFFYFRFDILFTRRDFQDLFKVRNRLIVGLYCLRLVEIRHTGRS